MTKIESNITIANLSKDERHQLNERIYINSPRLNNTQELIQYCHRHSKISVEPDCMLITGPEGAGKTTLIDKFLSLYPRQITRDGISVPVLDSAIPVPATVKNLVSALLSSLGDPLPFKGTTVSQTHRLKNLIHDCNVELIIIDEFQHFIDRDSNVILTTVSNWLKDLLNETGVPVVLIGMPYSDIILRSNPQLERRFAMRASLDPFSWDTDQEREEFRLFLHHLDEGLLLEKRSGLAEPETAFRIMCASNGIIGFIMKLVRRAAEIAIDNNYENIDIDLLAKAYEQRLSGRSTDNINPFSCQYDDLETKLNKKNKFDINNNKRGKMNKQAKEEIGW